MSNDLISRSALLQALKGNVLVDVTSNLENAIEEQPTAYDLDKVVKDLEEYAHSDICGSCRSCRISDDIDNIECENCGALGALEIVKGGGIRG
jgi:hypothetical protein